MNLAAIADQATKEIGMIGSRDVAFCKARLSYWHDRIYRARLWKDSQVEYVLPIDPAAAYLPGNSYLPTQGVIVMPAIFQLVSAVRCTERALTVQSPTLFYRVDQDSFNKSGAPMDFCLQSAVVAALDTPTLIYAEPDNSDLQKVVHIETLQADGVSENVQDVTLQSDHQYLDATGAILRLTKPVTQQPLFIVAGPMLALLQPQDTTAPLRQRVRLVQTPTQATTLRILGKRNPPRFSADTDEPGVAGMEGILFHLAKYSMLCRDERGGTPEATEAITMAVGPRFLADGTSGGMLLALEREEVAQAAYNVRIMPSAGFGPDEYYVGPIF